MPMLDPNTVKGAVDLLVKLHPHVIFTTKNGKPIMLFPPQTSPEASQALSVLAQADQTIHQQYLGMDLNHMVSTVRNMYHYPTKGNA